MKRLLFLGLALGASLVVLGVLTPPLAHAGEVPLGVIVSTDAGAVNNSNNFAASAGGNIYPYIGKPFAIGGQPGNTSGATLPITVLCDVACLVGTDINNCGNFDGGYPCLPLAANTPLPTRCNTNGSVLWDGGTGCLVTFMASPSTANLNATVWKRSGLE